jgi:hypothetical protein
MKTRFFSTAALLLLTVGLTEKVNGHNEKDSASVLAFVETGKSHSTTINKTEMNAVMESNAYVLENWIADRENWEQEGTGFVAESSVMERIHLGEWISEREAWEQESEPNNTTISELVSLMEWIDGRENWEQEDKGKENPGFAGKADILGQWVAERENWEQK